MSKQDKVIKPKESNSKEYSFDATFFGDGQEPSVHVIIKPGKPMKIKIKDEH